MATNPMVIPESERFKQLKDVLMQVINVVAAIGEANPKLQQEWPQLFLYLSYPWIVDQMLLSDEQKQLSEQRKREIAQLKFDGAEVKRKLEEILSGDKHLV